MKSMLMTAILLGATAAIATSQANITLDATIRDFSSSHPDFQGLIANDRGFIDATIGQDRKPVYAGGSGTRTTSGAAGFDQWFNDVPGVNQSTAYDLVLADLGGGVYQFKDRFFFPIDRQLLGNEGWVHNYNFTLELHGQFTYEPGQTLYCFGDDDVFVFIDGQKVIDLGGVHATRSTLVNLDTLDLTAGQDYAFDLFFAERHPIWSAFMLRTSFALEPVATFEPSGQPTIPAPGAGLLGVLGTGLVGWLRRQEAIR